MKSSKKKARRSIPVTRNKSVPYIILFSNDATYWSKTSLGLTGLAINNTHGNVPFLKSKVLGILDTNKQQRVIQKKKQSMRNSLTGVVKFVCIYECVCVCVNVVERNGTIVYHVAGEISREELATEYNFENRASILHCAFVCLCVDSIPIYKSISIELSIFFCLLTIFCLVASMILSNLYSIILSACADIWKNFFLNNIK